MEVFENENAKQKVEHHHSPLLMINTNQCYVFKVLGTLKTNKNS